MLLKWSSPANIAALAVMAAVVMAGCSGDATGLPARTEIIVVVDTVRGPGPGATVQCAVDLRASFRAVEEDVHQAEWAHATRLTYIGGVRVDSTEIAAPTVRTAWGGTTISNGSSAFSTWIVSAAAPFIGAFVFVYNIPGRGARSARVQFACQP